MPSPNQAMVAISPEWHRRLTAITAAETTRTGKRVTLRTVVEGALARAYPDAPTAAPITTVTTPAAIAPAASDDLFTQLVSAALQPDNAAIEAWGDKVIIGTYGKISVKALAYYLRAATTEINGMDELVRAYEAGA